ncbi:GNAT family N-acetyltransferase [Oryzibacter oryziterrae]|uniref:GNAT family N-acetyltransferase n=1 Tax=Oryzibacter oryziterrae TaxID=2766474 RepID=UPI001F356EE2|nr:GNAT family N-acetyltransferase [Oryzibacter oryziterrae]
MDLVIRDAVASDEGQWRQLWAGYLTFYKTELAEGVTAHTWQRLLDPASPLFCRVAFAGDRMVGFANCVLHEGTWVTQPICYLEDLFVDPDTRGAGVGRALIDDLLRLASERGWDRVYWHTHETNTTARKLYDRFRPANGFVVYQLDL